jgi:small GTP-binding protein
VPRLFCNRQFFAGTKLRIKEMNVSDLQPDPVVKIIFVGDTGVGKSSILTSFTENSFYPDYNATIGVDFRFRKVIVRNQRIKLQMWDTAGHERYRSITTGYYRGSHIMCLIYDITSRESFRNLKHWMDDIYKHGFLPLLFVVLGNKCDKESFRQVSQEEAGEFAAKYGAALFETSAKTHKNLEEAFHTMASYVIQKEAFWEHMRGGSAVSLQTSVLETKEKEKRCCWF